MFIAKKQLSRRTMLRGVGVALSLPLLESMAPAQTPLVRTAAKPLSRLGFVYLPHGAIMDKWTPAAPLTGPLPYFGLNRFRHLLHPSGVCSSAGALQR